MEHTETLNNDFLLTIDIGKSWLTVN